MNRPNSIRIWSGKHLDLANPVASEMTPADIYWGLASKFRFAGQTRGRLITVAEHSIAVSGMCAGMAKGRAMDRVEQEACRRAGLLHDAAEAFLGDVPTPGKRLVPGFEELEAPIVKAAAYLFDPRWGNTDWSADVLAVVRSADRICLAAEWKLLHPGAPVPPSISEAYPALVEAAVSYYPIQASLGDVRGGALALYKELVAIFGQEIVGAFEDSV